MKKSLFILITLLINANCFAGHGWYVSFYNWTNGTLTFNSETRNGNTKDYYTYYWPDDRLTLSSFIAPNNSVRIYTEEKSTAANHWARVTNSLRIGGTLIGYVRLVKDNTHNQRVVYLFDNQQEPNKEYNENAFATIVADWDNTQVGIGLDLFCGRSVDTYKICARGY